MIDFIKDMRWMLFATVLSVSWFLHSCQRMQVETMVSRSEVTSEKPFKVNGVLEDNGFYVCRPVEVK